MWILQMRVLHLQNTVSDKFVPEESWINSDLCKPTNAGYHGGYMWCRYTTVRIALAQEHRDPRLNMLDERYTMSFCYPCLES